MGKWIQGQGEGANAYWDPNAQEDVSPTGYKTPANVASQGAYDIYSGISESPDPTERGVDGGLYGPNKEKGLFYKGVFNPSLGRVDEHGTFAAQNFTYPGAIDSAVMNAIAQAVLMAGAGGIASGVAGLGGANAFSTAGQTLGNSIGNTVSGWGNALGGVGGGINPLYGASAGLGGTAAGAAGSAGLGGAAGGFNLFDPSTWTNPFSTGTNAGTGFFEGGGSLGTEGVGGTLDYTGTDWLDLANQFGPDGLGTQVNVGDLGNLGPLNPTGNAAWDTALQGLTGGGGDIMSGLSQAATELAKKIGPQAAKSLLSQAMSGEKSALDLLGGIAPGLLAALGSYQQQNALQGIADKARADRAPFLSEAQKWMAGGPEAWAAGPGAGAVKGVLHGLSAKFGNPIGSGTALQLATDSAANNWLNQTSQLANLGLGGNTAALDTAAVNAGGGMWTGAADAAGRLLTPQDDLASLLKRLQGSGINLGGTTLP